jgi:hypothetical protein
MSQPTVRTMYLGMSNQDRKYFIVAAMNKLNMTEKQVRDRIGGFTEMSIAEDALFRTWFEERENGIWRLKPTQEFFDLAKIPYPVPA